MLLTVPEFLVPNDGKRKGKEEVGTNGSSKAAYKVKGRNGKTVSSSALMKQADDAASAAGTSTSKGTHTATSNQCSSSSSAIKYSPPKSSRGNHDSTIPYALRHDQIVTALIDDALRNNYRKDETDNARQQQASPPSAPVVDIKSDRNDDDSNNIKDNNKDNSKDSTNNNHKSRTSPHRIKRNGLGGVSSSPGIHLLRKRQRSTSDDKLNNPTPPLPAKMRSTSSLSHILSDPSEFIHPDCIL